MVTGKEQDLKYKQGVFVCIFIILQQFIQMLHILFSVYYSIYILYKKFK